MSTEQSALHSLDTNLVASLQSQIDSLQIRVKELAAENAKLSSQLAQIDKKMQGSDEDTKKSETGDTKTKQNIEKVPGYLTRIMNHHCKRYVALKVMYFGKRFYGFASEAQKDPTVESEIFKALEKTRLLVGDKKESQYSRCGRTDKGVSSAGQVIALFLRSNLKVSGANNGIISEAKHEDEIDYVKVVNRVLPDDIRILGWCPVPVDFHARFSCLSREYKYFFWKENLNILAMESAGKKFVGEHDFRNFCKMDAANVHNYRRRVTLFEMSSTDVSYGDNQLWVIKIKGSAFLWHQVRCMVAVLFMVGRGLESPNVIEMLLDTDRIKRKPQYTMAAEIPLVLQSCEFEHVKFLCSSDAGEALRVHLVNECQTYQLQAAIFHEALLNCVPTSDDQILQHNGGTKKKASHVPLLSRPTEPSYEERRAKFCSSA
ncbi:hypothetical protein L6164_007449 [Bauhinia variegata]|uniref:Uncharacterized protein n=1 Tax=Bauhinia variegata TaxID=167791 RepID=A0ACB9PDP8_BAUVA|nr:hypothetical protein L6164_007449 [Bauhinia variegata]